MTLTEAETRTFIKALEGKDGVDILAAPKVVTLGGRQAQISMTQLNTVILGWNENAFDGKAFKVGNGNAPFQTTQVSVGTFLDVLPEVLPDGQKLTLRSELTVMEQVTSPKSLNTDRRRIFERGKWKTAEVRAPLLRLREIQSKVTVNDGHSLIIAGVPVEETIRYKDKIPLLGDVPIVGGLFRHEGRQTNSKMLVILISAQLIDPAGNRLH